MHTRLKTLRDTLAKYRKCETGLDTLFAAIEDLTENSDDLHVAFEGNPIDGFSVQGPFMSDNEAIDYFASGPNTDWWIARLEKPYDGNDLEVTPS